jgi:hypothetical protein
LSFKILILLLGHVAAWIHDNDDDHQQPRPCQRRRRLKGAIHANLLGYKCIHDSSPFEPDGAVIQVARAFSESLIDIQIICDHPTECHPSK